MRGIVDDEEDDHVATKVTAWIAVGSMIGLTAAAAFRWLNGSDFVLFPSALLIHHPSKKRPIQHDSTNPRGTNDTTKHGNQIEHIVPHTEQQLPTTMNRNRQLNELSDIEEYDDNEPNQENEDQQTAERLLQLEDHVNKLVETVHSAGERQERLLRQLLAEKDREITDQAVGFLRNQNLQNNTLFDGKKGVATQQW
jgi:hypothetical protein